MAGCATAQPVVKGLSDVPRRDQKVLESARSFLDFGEFSRALEPLEKLIEKNPDIADLYYMRAIAYEEMNDYPTAIENLEKGISLDGGKNPTVQKVIGKNYALNGNFIEALAAYRKQVALLEAKGASPKRIAEAQSLVSSTEFAAELMANPVPFVPEPLPGMINTPDHLEYFPSLSVDGRRIIFTRRLPNGGEDFFQSDLDSTGKWGNAIPLTGINTPLNEGAQTITARENYLIFTACDRPDGIGSCDLYYSQKMNGKWTDAKNLGTNINTRWRETQPSLSTDGNLLFFSSNREGGQGKHDLYVAGRLPNGGWGQPVNLGTTVNSAEDDLFPFWAADNRTLYFTTTGRPGMGGADLFKTTVNAQNEWEEPSNLGYPINTAGEETNIFISLDGRTAYFSKGEAVSGGGKDINIYSFELPEELRPDAATFVEVRVTDANTGAPLVVDVRLIPQVNDAEPIVRSTNEQGYFLTVLTSGSDYGFSVEKSGYLFYSDRFQMAEGSPSDPYRLNIPLQPIDDLTNATEAEADGAIALKNVFFATGSDELLGISGEELDRLVAVLNDRPAIRIELAGHTDDVGSDTANQSLSERRAISVQDYLVNKGIASGRIQTIGFGEARPVATNDTEEGRALNRRTTFRLLR